MLALTAASPAYRGFLSDIDCRWHVIAQSVDDRTSEELGETPLKHNRFVINKSRYDSIDCFIANDPRLKPEYNDIQVVVNPELCQTLVDNGVDELLARHVAHLFIRDPLVIYDELLEQNDETSSDHFENLQSTNWQTVRFKPPPPASSIGWRVEFRTMEVQLTDFENAAFAIFIVLITRVILSFNLNFYIPISKVDENMGFAQKRGAVLTERFNFRKNLLDDDQTESATGAVEDEYELMTIDEIINGKQPTFPGLIPLIHSYLDAVDVDVRTRCRLDRYLSLVSKRASGELITTATWIRQFVRGHPDYQHDSVISQQINYDLCVAAKDITTGTMQVPELLGEFAVASPSGNDCG